MLKPSRTMFTTHAHTRVNYFEKHIINSPWEGARAHSNIASTKSGEYVTN